MTPYRAPQAHYRIDDRRKPGLKTMAHSGREAANAGAKTGIREWATRLHRWSASQKKRWSFARQFFVEELTEGDDVRVVIVERFIGFHLQ